MQLLNRLLVIPKIFLTSYEDDRETLAEMQHLGYPLCKQFYQCFVLFDSRRAMSKHILCREVPRTFSCTLSSESGESTAKQMRMTWLSGYESGRRRS